MLESNPDNQAVRKLIEKINGRPKDNNWKVAISGCPSQQLKDYLQIQASSFYGINKKMSMYDA